MVKINLFDLARNNSKNLKKKYQEDEKYNELEDIRIFIENNWTLSINGDWIDFLAFLNTGNYINIYKRKIIEKKYLNEREIYSRDPETVAYDNVKFGKERKCFESSFQGGNNFKYGAIYLGGKGTSYGKFCLIFRRNDIFSLENSAILKRDSITYVKDSILLTKKLKGEISDRNAVSFLAILKHFRAFKKEGKENCDKILINGKSCLEFVTDNELKNIYVEKIMIPESFQNDMDRLIFKKYDPIKNGELTRNETYIISNYGIFRSLIKTFRIIEEVY